MISVTDFVYFGVPALGLVFGTLVYWNNNRAVRKLDRKMAAQASGSTLEVERHAEEVIVRIRGARSQGHALSS
jgi:hypothetical protein